jgi:hypothetical protein
MSKTTGYKIFREHKTGFPSTLFHSIDGSRALPLNTWMQAEERMVCNPGKKDKKKQFLSGWHFFSNKSKALKYLLSRFKHPEEMCVCRVRIIDSREKPRSAGCLLATFLHISNNDWKSRTKVYK